MYFLETLFSFSFLVSFFARALSSSFPSGSFFFFLFLFLSSLLRQVHMQAEAPKAQAQVQMYIGKRELEA